MCSPKKSWAEPPTGLTETSEDWRDNGCIADIRWKQRFQNFDRAFALLRSALEEKRVSEFNRLEQKGLIQRFEFTYELAWRTAKDYLQEMGVVFDEVTPKAVISAAFAAGLIKDGQLWIDMRLHRDMLSHSYEAVFKEVLQAVEQRYLSASGLGEAALGLLRETLAAAPMLRCAWLFGSRAKGTARSNFDIDIAVEGLAQSLAVESLRDRLNELPLPYAVDVQSLENIKNIE